MSPWGRPWAHDASTAAHKRGARRVTQGRRRSGSGGWRSRIANPVGRPLRGRSSKPIRNACSCGPVGRYQAELAEALLEAGPGAIGLVIMATAIAGFRTGVERCCRIGPGSRDWQRAVLMMPYLCLVGLHMHRLHGITCSARAVATAEPTGPRTMAAAIIRVSARRTCAIGKPPNGRAKSMPYLAASSSNKMATSAPFYK